MISFKEALTYMQDNCALDVVPNTTWSPADIKEYEAHTSMKLPEQLTIFMREVGQCAAEENYSFIVEYDQKLRSIHETQILVESKKHLISFHNMFIVEKDWPGRFPWQMIFFGTADAGHSYLLMDGNNKDNNSVYFWQRATDPFGTGNNTLGIGKVADSLFEFFYNLKSREEL